MANPTTRWDRVPIWGVYLDALTDLPIAGTVAFVVSGRITRTGGRLIYPDGASRTVTIGDTTQQDATVKSVVRAAWKALDQAANVSPVTGVAPFDSTSWDAWFDTVIVPAAVFTAFPATDDPNIARTGFSVLVRETLATGSGQAYTLTPLLTHLDNTPPGIDLATVEVPPGSPSSIPVMYAKGIAGGVAALNGSGLVVNADGSLPAGSGGGTVNAEDVRDIVAAALTQGANITISNNDPADTITITATIPIDDAGAVSTTKLWSSSKTQTAIAAAVTGLVAAAPGALDTLSELSAALGNDAAFSTTITAALGNRVRHDTAAQGLTPTQQANARTNIGAAEAATTPYVIYVNTTTRVFPQIPNPRPTTNPITFNATRLLDFSEAEAAAVLSYPRLAVGDILELAP